MSFDSIMDDLFTDEIKVLRYTKTRLIAGKQKASLLPPIKTVGSVQPLEGRERENLPDNFRQSYVLKLFVPIALLVSDEKKNQRADNLLIEGEGSEEFEVISSKKHRALDMGHYEVIAARVN